MSIIGADIGMMMLYEGNQAGFDLLKVSSVRLCSVMLQGMLSKIVALWEAMYVPLIHRSRFYLAFRGKELFFFDSELRRLRWLQSEIGNPEDPNPLIAQKAKRALARSARKLDVCPLTLPLFWHASRTAR